MQARGASVSGQAVGLEPDVGVQRLEAEDLAQGPERRSTGPTGVRQCGKGLGPFLTGLQQLTVLIGVSTGA